MRSKNVVILCFYLFTISLFFAGETNAQLQSSVGSQVTIVPTIIYTEFENFPETTNLTAIPFALLSDIENLTLQRQPFGRIRWLSNVSIVQGLGLDGYTIDIDTHIEIANNSIFINNSHFTGLVQPIEVKIVGLPFSEEPIVVINGDTDCDASLCTILDYSTGSGTLTFNSSALSFISPVTFEATLPGCGNNVSDGIEQCDGPDLNGQTCQSIGAFTGGVLSCSSCLYDVSACTSSGPGDDDDSGDDDDDSGPISTRSYSVDPLSFDLSLTQGESIDQFLLIDNTGDFQLSFSLSIIGLVDFISFDQSEFVISAGQSRIVTMTISIPDVQVPDILTGNIEIGALPSNQTINIVLNVEGEEPLFDMEVVLRDTKVIPGNALRADISITDVADLGPVVVELTYLVKDFENNEYPITQEPVTIDGVLELERSFPLPDGLKIGEEYEFVSRLTYEGEIVTASASFSYVRFPASFFVILGIILIGVISGIIFLLVWLRNTRKDKKEENLKEINLPRI